MPWISKDISTRDDTRAFVAGFRERDIPVGVVVLDSPWETNYNTFVPNPTRYPDFEASSPICAPTTSGSCSGSRR
jgi:alpha-glucosidase (family GH31 glycosyl hydrolase)